MHSYYHHTGRRIFFWTLVVIYICAVSLIIPYAFGYRFSADRGVFVYSGSITVKSNPRNVSVSIDGRTDKNPNFINDTYHIAGVAPGAHTITVTRDGFQSAEKTVTVTSGVSTELWNMILPRTSYERTQIGQTTHPLFFRAPNDALIASTATDADGELALTIIDARNDADVTQETFAPRTTRPSTPHITRNIEWSQNGDLLIVPTMHVVQDTGVTTQDILQDDALVVSRAPFSSLAMRNLFPNAGTVGNVRWHPRNRNTLYAQIDDTVTEVSLTFTDNGAIADADTRLIANDVRTYTIANGTLYYLTNRTGVVHRVIDGNEIDTRQVTTSPTTLTGGDITLTVYDDDRMTLRRELDGALEIFDALRADVGTLLASGVRGTHFSDDGKKLLYWTNNEVSVYFVRAWDVQPVRSAGDTITIARFAQLVDNVQWTEDYEHALYSVEDTLKLTSLDGRGGHTTHTIMPLDADSIVRSDHRNNLIYVTRAGTEAGAYSLETITFPEREGLFQ